MVLDHFKWDPQVGDVATLARFPIVLPASVANDLGKMAEALAAETAAAEWELLARPELQSHLGIPRGVRGVLGDSSLDPTPAAARVIRFDFHPTTDGWRISEANNDVPGGYTEASSFPRLMAEHYPGCRPAGDPLTALVNAIHERYARPGRIGLLAAPGFMEDQQIVACIANAFRRRGWTTVLGRPTQVEWDNGHAKLQRWAVDCIFRFFQGEWLSRLRTTGTVVLRRTTVPVVHCWQSFLRGGRTPVCNPGTALFVESKRFPLVWDELKTAMPVWRALLPETRDPRSAPWRRDTDWLLKAAFGNNGDEVADRERNTRRDWRKAAWAARLRPTQWAAQRRFDVLPVATPCGPMYPCLGVYAVNGRASGIYGRMSARPFIDYSAIDVAVLVRDH
jgi:hypothetical protein